MKKIKTKIVGLTFVLGEGYEQLLNQFRAGKTLQLKAEPTNVSDKNAVSVWDKDVKIGYLSKKIAKDIHAMVYRARAKITKITGKKQGINILIEIRELGDSFEEYDVAMKSIELPNDPETVQKVIDHHG